MFLSQNPATGAKRLTPENLRMSCGMPVVSPVQKGHGRGTADRPYFAVQGTASTASQVVRLALETYRRYCEDYFMAETKKLFIE